MSRHCMSEQKYLHCHIETAILVMVYSPHHVMDRPNKLQLLFMGYMIQLNTETAKSDVDYAEYK